MIAIETVATNAVLTGEDCFDLPICRDPATETQSSWWTPDADELAQLVAGVPLRLTVFGRWHPPVKLTVGE